MKVIISLFIALCVTMSLEAQELKPFKHDTYGLYGYKDDKGQIVVQPLFDYAGNFFEGMAVVAIGGKWGYIDRTGKQAIPLKYEEATEFSEGLAAVKLNGKWGYIDKTGAIKIVFIYANAKRFTGCCAEVTTIDGDEFRIDKAGYEVQ